MRFNHNSIQPENTPYRSQLENTWAEFFTNNSIDFIYETPVGEYKPDFYIPMFNLFLECKGGYYTEKDINRTMEIAQKTGLPQALTINDPDLFSPFDLYYPDGTITKAVFIKQEGEIKILEAKDNWLPLKTDDPLEWEESLSIY